MSEVTKKQIEDLGAKLEKFAKDLPKAERDVLGWVLQRASTASGQLSDKDLEQVSGGLLATPTGGFSRPTSSLLGKSLTEGGMGGKLSGADALAWRVSWSW